MKRVCACGCGASMEGKRPNARYASAGCRTRDWKRRHSYVDGRRRKASRNGRQRQPEVRLTYANAIEAARAVAMGHDPERAVAGRLTDRQKQALAQRDTNQRRREA